MLDERFETDLVKALFGFDAIVGNYASPYAAGSAYVMLHHAFGEVNGKKGVWGHAIGGMGAITQAMAKAAGAHRVRIDVNAAVREIIVERDSQKAIVIGKGGEVLKEVGTAVRRSLPPGAFLDLHVKVERRWQNRSEMLDRLGY